MAKSKRKQARPPAAEHSRRGAAAMAHATRGRSTTVESKKLYNRRRDKSVVAPYTGVRGVVVFRARAEADANKPPFMSEVARLIGLTYLDAVCTLGARLL